MEIPQPSRSNLILRTLATSNTMQCDFSPAIYSCGGNVSSPMTTLAHNLSELNTGRCGTPRRKLSLCDTPDSMTMKGFVYPSPERSISTESGCFVDTPTPLDSPAFDFSVDRFSSLPNLNGSILGPASSAVAPPSAGGLGGQNRRRKCVSLRRYHSMLQLQSEMMEEDCENIPPSSSPMTSSPDSQNNTDSDASSNKSSSTSGSSSVSPKKAVFYFEESNSQDSGLESDRDSRESKYAEESFEFAAPRGMPPMSRRHRIISEDTCSPFKYSPVKGFSPMERRNSCPVGTLDFSGEIVKTLEKDESPESPLKICRLTSVDEGIMADDGFLDVMDQEVASLMTQSTGAMASLFNAPLINKNAHVSADQDDTIPVTRRVVSRRNLVRSMSMDVRGRSQQVKRDRSEESRSPLKLSFSNGPRDESTPKQEPKRRRPSSVLESPVNKVTKPTLHRCHSESEAMIKSALNRQQEEPDLIGDCSRTYCLPTMKGKHQDLKSISGETLSRVINGEFSHEVEKCIIVDCRYPYEYEGGHIKGALNLYTHDGVLQKFLMTPITSSSDKRVIIVFHCEFSSERGPKLSRFLRSKDRAANKDNYPFLHYPEIYLLDGGYKAFYETEKNHCFPMSYKPMLHKDHCEDLRHFRIKSKSWAAGSERNGRPGFRPLKF